MKFFENCVRRIAWHTLERPVQLVQQQAGQPGYTASIRFDHILDGGVNTLRDGTKVGTGGHYLRSSDVRVTQQTGAADASGVTKGYVQIRDPDTGGWVAKPASQNRQKPPSILNTGRGARCNRKLKELFKIQVQFLDLISGKAFLLAE
jgi:hypothetical protein